MKWTLTFLVLALGACGERGSGNYSFDSRRVDPFLEIENLGEANVYASVEPGAQTGDVQLTVTGDDNLLDAVRTFVRGDTLVVDTDRDVWPQLELRVVVTVERLVALDNDGSGDLHVHGLEEDCFVVVNGSGDATVDGQLDRLEVRVTGSGDAELTGSANALELVTTGSGDVGARDLAARDADVNLSGSGDVEVCVTGTLDAAISGSGDIDYYCDPDTVHPASSGSGEIIGH